MSAPPIPAMQSQSLVPYKTSSPAVPLIMLQDSGHGNGNGDGEPSSGGGGGGGGGDSGGDMGSPIGTICVPSMPSAVIPLTHGKLRFWATKM